MKGLFSHCSLCVYACARLEAVVKIIKNVKFFKTVPGMGVRHEGARGGGRRAPDKTNTLLVSSPVSAKTCCASRGRDEALTSAGTFLVCCLHTRPRNPSCGGAGHSSRIGDDRHPRKSSVQAVVDFQGNRPSYKKKTHTQQQQKSPKKTFLETCKRFADFRRAFAAAMSESWRSSELS